MRPGLPPGVRNPSPEVGYQQNPARWLLPFPTPPARRTASCPEKSLAQTDPPQSTRSLQDRWPPPPHRRPAVTGGAPAARVGSRVQSASVESWACSVRSSTPRRRIAAAPVANGLPPRLVRPPPREADTYALGRPGRSLPARPTPASESGGKRQPQPDERPNRDRPSRSRPPGRGGVCCRGTRPPCWHPTPACARIARAPPDATAGSRHARGAGDLWPAGSPRSSCRCPWCPAAREPRP